MDGMNHRDVLTGHGRGRRGRLERDGRGRGRGMTHRRRETHTPLPRYTERDEGNLRLPGYECEGLPAYGSDDLERAAWLEERRSDGHIGQVEIELQVLERAVLR